MISNLRGTVVAVAEDRMDVSIGPIALTALVPTPIALVTRVGEQVDLCTTLIVREDSLTLYGFADAVARDDFNLLLAVSGVGPRLALAIVSTLQPAALRSAVAANNLAVLTSVPGVGKKSAERLVIELRDRLTPIVASATGHAMSGDHATGWQEQVRTALHGLGWNPRDAQSAVDAVAGVEFDDGVPASEQPVHVLLRAALRSLDRS